MPEGIVLEPGKEPRLHACAPLEEFEPGSGVSASAPTEAPETMEIVMRQQPDNDLHACARPDAAGEGVGAANGEPGTLPRASDFVETVTAATLPAALEADEGRTPLPEKMCDIEMWVEPDVLEMWNAKVAELRASIRPDLQEWEVLAILMHNFITTWDNKETRRQARENPILERGG